MVWKGNSFSSSSSIESRPARPEPAPKPRVNGGLIALIGEESGEAVKPLNSLDDNLLGYNLGAGIALVRYEQNDRGFDKYVSMAFTKGVTERKTGRTMVILASDAHHGEAMLGQFDGVSWSKGLEDVMQKYGDTVRWINVGDTKNGFIGLDYDVNSRKEGGVATKLEDVKFLANILLKNNYNQAKRLYLLKPPYIVEREEGKDLRNKGFITIGDYASKPLPK